MLGGERTAFVREGEVGNGKWFLPRLGEEGGSGKPSGTDGSPGRLRGSATRPACRSLQPAVPLASRALVAAASDRGWETRCLPSGAYYQQLLLLSPPRISLPTHGLSRGSISSHPSLSFPASTPSPRRQRQLRSSPARRRRRRRGDTRSGSKLWDAGAGGGRARSESGGPWDFKPSEGG